MTACVIIVSSSNARLPPASRGFQITLEQRGKQFLRISDDPRLSVVSTQWHSSTTTTTRLFLQTPPSYRLEEYSRTKPDSADPVHTIPTTRKIGVSGMRRCILVTTTFLGLLLAHPSASGQGLIAPTAGPINSAMAGASTAAPIEFGSTYWNPANLSGLDRNEFLLGNAVDHPEHPPDDGRAGRDRRRCLSAAEPLWSVAQR